MTREREDAMDVERWRRVESLFHRALPLSASERVELLSAECGADTYLRAQVERLLAADESPHELVDRMDGGALRPAEDPLIGREIGRYRLIARIGVGGMGLVYRAERTDGLFRHEVAIKLIRIELATDALVRRFEFERRTLAALHHPNIAQLLDGGTTEDGRPYLVMELVRGVPIDRWCDEHTLSIEERLELFVQVCRGVHAAHQSLVVHRDLKPGNVLIDETGAPKLLDFGIARLLDESASETRFQMTLTAAQILTPDYASPEQLTLGPVTTAMDVYSLGVVLYELLTGRRPFRSENRTPIEWHRDVIERTPTRPSNSVVAGEPAPALDPSQQVTSEELANRRGLTPRGLQRRLRGDLDRIVLMALRKEPERRYGSAKDFADDIERHFSGHPVQARGDSLGYRTTKFVQRNKIAVGAGFAVAAALVVGIVLARKGELRAREGEKLAEQGQKRAIDEKERANEQARHARFEAKSFEHIADFLMVDFLTARGTLDAEELEDRRHRIQMEAARVRREFGDVDKNHLRANLLDSLGHVAQKLGFTDDAEALVREAMAIRSGFGEQELEYALSLSSLGRLYYARGDMATAADEFRKALAIHRAHAPEETHTDVPLIANNLAACLRGLGRLEEAEALHVEALELRRKAADKPLDVAESLNNIAGIEIDRNDWPSAAKRLEESLEIRKYILGDEDPLTLQSMSNLSQVCWRMGQRERAHALLEDVEKSLRALRVNGEEDLARVLMNHATMWISEGRAAAAEPMLDEALSLQIRRIGATHPAVATTLERQARVQFELKRPAQARTTWERAVAIRRAPDGSPRALGQALYEYGTFLWATKARDEGRAALSEAVDVLRKSGMTRTPQLGRAEMAYGEVLLALGDAAGARPHLEEAVSIFEAGPGQEKDLADARERLQRCNEAKDG